MNTANRFFQCVFEAIQAEITQLLKSGVLDRHRSEKRHARVLNRVFQEGTLRYIALRKFYETAETSRVTFDTEFGEDKGPIDLILVEEPEQYAFELKRWQEGKSANAILGKDYDNLTGFAKAAVNRHAYSVIFTDNDHQDLVSNEEFLHNPQGFYENQFRETFGQRYRLCECKVTAFGTFTVCALLATPKQDANECT